MWRIFFHTQPFDAVAGKFAFRSRGRLPGSKARRRRAPSTLCGNSVSSAFIGEPAPVSFATFPSQPSTSRRTPISRRMSSRRVITASSFRSWRPSAPPLLRTFRTARSGKCHVVDYDWLSSLAECPQPTLLLLPVNPRPRPIKALIAEATPRCREDALAGGGTEGPIDL